MTVRFFHYQDASAPQLNNAAGSLKNIIKSCLVGTSGIAYGSKASIGGWTVAFETGNVIAFRTGVGTSQYYYRLDDNGPGAAGGAEARMHLYRTMSDLNTGTGRFPDTTIGGVMRKANSSSNYPWWIIGDERTFYMRINFTATADGNFADLYCFGETDSVVPADTYNVVVVARSVENSVSRIYPLHASTASPNTSRLIARNGFTSSGENNLAARSVFSFSETEIGSSVLAYPGISGGIILRPAYWIESGGTAATTEIRGLIRGVYHHSYTIATLPNATQLTGVTGYSGRTFRVSEPSSETGTSRPIFDLTGPW